MNNNLKDILSHLNKDIEQDKLLEYLNNQLADAEKHSLESSMNEDEFISDAMDGLQEMENKKDVSSIVDQLNSGLKKQLEKRKKRKNKKAIAEQSWLYYTIVVLLVLIVIAYVIIKKIHA